MALGPGKYDKLCTYVRRKANARTAIVIVIGGHKGGGFSVQGSLDDTIRVSAILREMADRLDKDAGMFGG